MSRKSCTWCNVLTANDEPNDPDNDLCRSHLAEYYGLSESELDRCDDEHYAEYADCMGW